MAVQPGGSAIPICVPRASHAVYGRLSMGPSLSPLSSSITNGDILGSCEGAVTASSGQSARRGHPELTRASCGAVNRLRGQVD